MPDRSFLAWPFFEDRHRDHSARLEEWCAANLPVDHGDVDAACCELVEFFTATDKFHIHDNGVVEVTREDGTRRYFSPMEWATIDEEKRPASKVRVLN